MVVKDEDTLHQALSLVERFPVRYSDEHEYAVITSSEVLERLCRGAFARNSVAIVVPTGEEDHMESFPWELKVARQERRYDEQRRVREWMRTHPEALKRFKRRVVE